MIMDMVATMIIPSVVPVGVYLSCLGGFQVLTKDATLQYFGVLVSFGAASGPPPELALAVLAKKALYITRPSLAPHTATPELTEEISSPLFEAIRGGISISINQTFPLKDAANAHRALQSRKTTGSTILEI